MGVLEVTACGEMWDRWGSNMIQIAGVSASQAPGCKAHSLV